LKKLADKVSLELNISDETIEIKGEWFEPVIEKTLGGKDVKVLEIDNTTVVVEL